MYTYLFYILFIYLLFIYCNSYKWDHNSRRKVLFTINYIKGLNMKNIDRSSVNAYLNIIESINASIDKADIEQNMQKVDALCELVSDFKIELSNIIRGIK